MTDAPETVDDLLLRTEKSLEVIAQEAGIARRTLFNARGGQMPRRGTIVKLARFLRVSAARLVAAIEASRAAKA